MKRCIEMVYDRFYGRVNQRSMVKLLWMDGDAMLAVMLCDAMQVVLGGCFDCRRP